MVKCFWETVLWIGFPKKSRFCCSNLISQDKAGSRKKKLDLINAMNPEWRDLYDDL
jgi:hypothetical protein